MFVFERLFAVAIYTISLLIVVFLIEQKVFKPKKILIGYIILLSVFAFYYEPYITADLYRIREIIKSFSSYNFIDFTKTFLKENPTPVSYILYWLVGKSGDVRILPAIATIVTYSSIFYIVIKYSQLNNISPKNIAVTVLFIMSTGSYMIVISNIRTMLALSLIIFCFFRETVLKKFSLLNILIYAIASLTHSLALVLVVIRFFVFIMGSSIKMRLKFFIFLLSAIVFLYVLLYQFWLIDSIIDKALGYITGDKYSYIWDYITSFIALIIMTFTLKIYHKSKCGKLKEVYNYIIICIVVAILLIFEFSIFSRLIVCFVPILLIPILLNVLSNNVITAKQRNILFLLCILMLFVVCSRGSLSSLKFFVL